MDDILEEKDDIFSDYTSDDDTNDNLSDDDVLNDGDDILGLLDDEKNQNFYAKTSIDEEFSVSLSSNFSYSNKGLMMKFMPKSGNKGDKKGMKRKFIEQEIVATEATYYDGLDTLLNEMILPLFKNKYIDKKYYKQITSSIPKLVAFHEAFLDEMNAIYDDKENEEQQMNAVEIYNKLEKLMDILKISEKAKVEMRRLSKDKKILMIKEHDAKNKDDIDNKMEKLMDSLKMSENARVAMRALSKDKKLQMIQEYEFMNKPLSTKTKKTKKQSLAKVFNECIMKNKEEFVDIYIEFIKDYKAICDLFGKTFHKNDKLQEFLKQKRAENKPLSHFLILPVQRVPRYVLLLTELKKNTATFSEDYKDINDAVEMIKDITSEINEKKRKIENLAQCMQIQESLNGLPESIVSDDRVFVEQFVFIKKEIKHQRLFFLFNDIVIVANEKWKVKNILDIRTLEVRVLSENWKDNNTTNKKSKLVDFKLISCGIGSVDYVGKDINVINKFKKLVGKSRVNVMSGDLQEEMSQLGSLENELNRQALLYDD